MSVVAASISTTTTAAAAVVVVVIKIISDGSFALRLTRFTPVVVVSFHYVIVSLSLDDVAVSTPYPK